ncbi:hypothetical protein [Mucilaginibacter polytrichastri]|nr:hypothetical protein [Mucilaginibacter polytrichastri]SFT24691.1 hypothetical protein SAMN04487890_12233 [Mucilaginibacter polytrichastri]
MMLKDRIGSLIAKMESAKIATVRFGNTDPKNDPEVGHSSHP